MNIQKKYIELLSEKDLAIVVKLSQELDKFKNVKLSNVLYDWLKDVDINDDFKEDCINKFIEGRLEHQDDLKDLDCKKEFYDEMLDAFSYSFIHDNLQS